jgi:hypothetical protein
MCKKLDFSGNAGADATDVPVRDFANLSKFSSEC